MAALLLVALAPGASLASPDRDANAVNTWSPTGSMTTARENHTATLLPNGQVLVAGGHCCIDSTGSSAELYDPASGAWTPTGSMTSAHESATATLLPTGKVLVAGGLGNNGSTATASADLYDPTTGTWTATGSMTVPRWGHTATLLPTGKVLVTGGGCACAELYDPTAGTWTATGSMSVLRNFHTATLLSNGSVLVAGGCDEVSGFCRPLSSAELYDPATGSWTLTRSMSIPRASHTATRLPDGQVLVAGGTGSCTRICPGAALSSAELYDPVTGTWTVTGSMSDARWGHTATLLPTGRVLVTGGCCNPTRPFGALSRAELYDPHTGSWSDTASMNTGRAYHTATLLSNGQVLVAGGDIEKTGVISPLASAEIYTSGAGPLVQMTPGGLMFGMQAVGAQSTPQTVTITNSGTLPLVVGNVGFDGANPQQYIQTNTCSAAPVPPAATCTITVRFAPVAAGHRPASLSIADNAPTSPQRVYLQGYATGPNAWTPTGSMTTNRVGQTATLLPSGQVLVAGGSGQASAELYDPQTGVWTPTGSMTAARQYATATLLPNGQVLVAGGSGQASAELYDPQTGAWTPTSSMHTARQYHTATLLPNGQVLVAGGEDCANGPCTVSASAELYDPHSGTWSSAGAMIAARWQHTATLLPDGSVLVTGGLSSTSFTSDLASAELFDPHTGQWAATGAMATARTGHTATLLPGASGQVLVAGGLDAAEQVLASAELYDPHTGAWTPTGDLSTARAYHTATLLPDGRVLVAGGSGSCTPFCPCNYCPGPNRDSAELYDGPSGSWIPTGAMVGHVASQTATLLANGTVLAAGGEQCTNRSCDADNAEIYTPGPGPLARFSPPTLAFGPHEVGTTSAPLTSLVTNAGTQPLVISSVVLTGTDRVDYTLASACTGQPIAPGGACPVVIRFAPTVSSSPARRLAVVHVSDNVPSSPQDLPLSGQATGPTTWAATGSMAATRSYQSATLLPDGRVLVAGGCCSSEGYPLASAELYDPRTGVWSPTGSMGTAREYQTVTLLLDGRVLVAGGCCNPEGYALASAELYDPRTGVWSPTGSMSAGREYHTATLLPNGTVLVAGGGDICCDHTGLTSAELYDPASGTWAPTGSMRIGRELHTATLLPNGTVLVAGGCCNGLYSLASAELYDPATGMWSLTGLMSTPRSYHSATLVPGGRVLVAGGCDLSNGAVPCGHLASAELYDPATGAWSPTGSMLTGRTSQTATLVAGGQVLVAGGMGFAYDAGLASAELYDPITGVWTATGSMSTGRLGQTATLLSNGRVLVAGGGTTIDGFVNFSSAELYTPVPGLMPRAQH